MEKPEVFLVCVILSCPITLEILTLEQTAKSKTILLKLSVALLSNMRLA